VNHRQKKKKLCVLPGKSISISDLTGQSCEDENLCDDLNNGQDNESKSSSVNEEDEEFKLPQFPKPQRKSINETWNRTMEGETSGENNFSHISLSTSANTRRGRISVLPVRYRNDS
jgi:hypothetical protein